MQSLCHGRSHQRVCSIMQHSSSTSFLNVVQIQYREDALKDSKAQLLVVASELQVSQ